MRTIVVAINIVNVYLNRLIFAIRRRWNDSRISEIIGKAFLFFFYLIFMIRKVVEFVVASKKEISKSLNTFGIAP